MNPRRTRAIRPTGQQGFTLIELLVALAVTVIVVLGILLLFDFNNKLTRVQTNVADMQQSERIAQYDMVRMARMAGRGGLPVSALVVNQSAALPLGSGISVLNNAPANTHLVAADTSSPKVLLGTDVLTLRGAFSTPIYEAAFANPSTFTLTGPGTPTPATATGGTVAICDQSPSGAAQDLTGLTALIDLAAGGKIRKEALILVSPTADTIYSIVALDPSISTKTAATCPGNAGVTIAFISDPADPMVAKYRALYPAPVGNLNDSLKNVAFVGLLEEYRYYVREDHAIAGTDTSDLTPVLSRARFYPGTDLVYADEASNLKQDIADGIVDLQIAFGIDANSDGQLTTDPPADPATDEWLGNAAADTAITGGLKAIRISTLARTNRRDHDYVAPVLASLEDHTYSTTDINDPVNGYDAVNFKGSMARLYRRRVLQTVVNLRNLTQ
ncbi:MAG TPA: PilW family protein [Thermoanaerobaculia bacterium]|jgi:prepilin-type N-terminal cleavage/methylation domain-containing protein|nr:PilW family protein [Thermoanaerobaculia bacterium]